MAGAAIVVKQVFTKNEKLTAGEIGKICPLLKPSQISMALNYLLAQRYVTRELILNPQKGRKRVWQYTYHPNKVEKKEMV